MIYPIDDIPYFAKLEIIFYACTCALICTCAPNIHRFNTVPLYIWNTQFLIPIRWKKAGKSINMCNYYIKMVKRRMDHILRTFFILSTNSLCFLALGGLGAENRTPLSSKQSNFSTWKSWQKFEDLNNTINFKPTHPQPKKSMAESFVF
jgi:hypothetical protein